MRRAMRLQPGDRMRLGTGRGVYLVEWLERAPANRVFLVAQGPLDSPRAKGGMAFCVGPGALTRISPISGEMETLRPVRVRVASGGLH